MDAKLNGYLLKSQITDSGKAILFLDTDTVITFIGTITILNVCKIVTIPNTCFNMSAKFTLSESLNYQLLFLYSLYLSYYDSIIHVFSVLILPSILAFISKAMHLSIKIVKVLCEYQQLKQIHFDNILLSSSLLPIAKVKITN